MSLDRYIDTLAQPCQIGLNTLDRVRAKQLDTIKGRNPQGRQNRPDLAVVNSFEIVPPTQQVNTRGFFDTVPVLLTQTPGCYPRQEQIVLRFASRILNH